MFYPAHINLQDRKCLVVGGGTVAERKVVAMLLSGGDVTVISPDATELLTFLANIGTIRWHKRQLAADDTQGYFLVCAATDFTDINSAVFAKAHDKNKIRLVNVVDVIPQCTFAAASVVTDGEILLSISTSGKSPATSRRIREHLEETLRATSLYTLGYEDGEPVPIANQGLPYPVYLLLENRPCIILCEQKTPAIERRVSLLRQCGASVLCMAPDAAKPHHLEDAFLVIADKFSAVDRLLSITPPYQGGIDQCRSEGTFIREYLDAPDAGTHFTPKLIIDDNLIISISARSSRGIDKVKHLHKKLTNQFENNGYGVFIEFLGTRRSEILKAFPTPKRRADFFEVLINTVETNNTQPQTCCLGLTNPGCSAECLFNWVRQGKLKRANTFTSTLLDAQH
ncbi:bifunctional precorrin-2 dehydrogenase/sirohydrochlorin ferrochelatase [Candidatus Poribacteria bacterium]|nr:bifunctional precorrin-2 dehydrogenase/sirohydrochlorin ferrochelatase [Candidatus Poribacteria bacterium]